MLRRNESLSHDLPALPRAIIGGIRPYHRRCLAQARALMPGAGQIVMKGDILHQTPKRYPPMFRQLPRRNRPGRPDNTCFLLKGLRPMCRAANAMPRDKHDTFKNSMIWEWC
ncbi:hypothetical protein AA105894_0248 [Asaia spathodeae NBRC 105894]|nr:hypothetical protein AA105894_0248 [Asaia spathodeae NBRC 105894]